MKKTKKKGFTLVELIIVIAVIGVLAAILIPVFSNVIKKANSKSALADARNAVSQYVTESLERRLQSLIPIPEQIVLIVEKGGRYYIFGYDTSVTQSVQVSSVNEEGIPATGLQALINSLSWNAHHSENYDPNTTTTYSVDTDGAFYLVPYTGTTPDNPNVRGFVTSTGVSGSFLRLDKEDDEGYGFNLNLGNDTVAFHGCLVNGTYDTESTTPSNNGGSGGGSETASYSVNFTTTGIDDGDLGNVVYKKGGASLTNPATLTEGTGVGTLTAECPVATSAYSYTFTGATASNGHSAIDEADMTITFAFTKVMAQTYHVTYNANGGSGTMTDNTDYLTNAVVTLPANTFTAPEHKHFTGWKINNTGELRAAGYQFNITADTEIYAQWADDTAYTVSFDANGGTGSMASIPSVYAGAYELPECAFTKTHYHFNGWLANNAGDPIFPHSNYDLSADVTFYATWEQDTTYTITYDGNGATSGTAPTDANSYYMNDTANLLGKGSLAYTHKHFTGWRVANGGSLLAAGSEYTVTGSVTMYAQWEDDATYTVTYNANGGSGTVTDSNTYYSGDTVTLKANTFTYTHKHFTGWLVNNTGDLKQAGNTFTITANATVYAQWDDDATYTVTYDKNTTDSVSGMPSNDTGVYAGSHTLSSATPTRTGYDFIGWGETSGATSTVSSITVSDNTTVYAIWEQNAVSSNVYYYGGAYWNSADKLDWNATKLPEVSGNRPQNILEGLTLDTTLLNGTVVNRTFEATSATSVVDGVTYVKCNETTDWSGISGVTIVEQTAGATYSGSQSIVTILNTSRQNSITNATRGKQYVLIADMDLSSVSWKTAISKDTYDYFLGRFDGMGYTANGMTSREQSSCCNTSFFGYINNSQGHVGIQNFNISNIDFSYTSTKPKDLMSGFSQSINGSSSSYECKVINCHASGNIVFTSKTSTATGSIGGIGNCLGKAVFDGCSSSVNFNILLKVDTTNNSSPTIGGISGNISGTIKNCRYNGNIIANTYSGVGGIAGKAAAAGGSITGCKVSGFIRGYKYIGGILGNAAFAVTVRRCGNSANVSGLCSHAESGYNMPINASEGIGGICGYASGSVVSISECWSKGDIYSDAGAVGGIIGITNASNTITDCWVAGRVAAWKLYTEASGTTGTAYRYNAIGGLVGRYDTSSSSDSISQNNIKRCIVYADVFYYSKNASSAIYGFAYTAGNTADASYRLGTVKTASSMSINTTTGVITLSEGYATTPNDSTGTVGSTVADLATLKSSMQSAWTTTAAWNLTGTYPVLADNSGSPS